MATIRHHIRIDRPPDEVWATVADAGAISTWFPMIEDSYADGATRHVTLRGGARLEEQIVTSDGELRRFQYRITGGDMPLDFHLGTVDVLADGDGSLVVYSTELEPDGAKRQMDPTIAQALDGLKDHLES